MRYYDLTITPQGSTVPFRQWTSHPGGIFNPRAQNIEFDIPVSAFNTPTGAATITVHGVSLEDLQQANSWGLVPPTPENTQWTQGMSIVLRGGMQAGLPLANPKQAGVILSGQIVQAFGNWEGTDMSLDMVVMASSYSTDTPGNIVLNWKAGMSLSTALSNCLNIAFPGMPQSFNLSPNLVLDYDTGCKVPDLTTLATWLNQFTDKRLLNPVYIAVNAGTIWAYDSLYQASPVQIQFTDMIGQPVWIAPGVMQSKFVMRADLQVGGAFSMPQGLQDLPGIVQTRAASSPSQLRTKTTFPSSFYITEIRHIGNFRSPDGSTWATVVNGATIPGG